MTMRPMSEVETIKTIEGFKVYGPFGSVMHADSNKVVTYCNLNESANGYKRLKNSLNKA